MKFISLILFAVSCFAQIPNFPTVSPSIVNVTLDLAKDNIVNAPKVFISSNLSPFAFNTIVPNNNPAVLVWPVKMQMWALREYAAKNNKPAVLVWPVQGFVPPGTTTSVRMSIINSNLTVGSYVIPVNFVQNSPSVSVSVGINLTVIDSRTFTTSQFR